jgi:hypothetical protein
VASGTQFLFYPVIDNFAGWGGACSGSAKGVCGLTITSNVTVIANFSALPPDFSMVASDASPNPITAGQSSTASLNVTAVNGFSDSVSLSCSVQPTPQLAPQCSLSPTSVTAGTTTTLTVTTTASATAIAMPSEHFRFLYSLWLPIGMILLGIGFGTQSRKKALLLSYSLLIAGLVFQMGCGGGNTSQSRNSGTPKGQYAVTITGTSGTLNHSAQVMLIVQ